MAVVSNDETVIPSVFVFPCLDIERRNLVWIPEIRIHSIVYHFYLFIWDAVDQPDGIHGIIGYAVIEIIGEAENKFFKTFIYSSFPSSLVTPSESSEDFMDGENDSFMEESAEQ